MRRVLDAAGTIGDGVLRFEIEANAFCHQMVRSIVGTLVEVGYGRRSGGRRAGRSSSPRDRNAAGQSPHPTASASGR